MSEDLKKLTEFFLPYFSSDKRMNMALDITMFLKTPKTDKEFHEFKTTLCEKYQYKIRNVDTVIEILMNAGLLKHKDNQYFFDTEFGIDFNKKFQGFITTILRSVDK